MKIRSSGLFLVLFLLAAATCFAANDALMGTWKLNESKSKITAGAPKNNTVVYEAAGDGIKVTIDGTAAVAREYQRSVTRCIGFSRQ